MQRRRTDTTYSCLPTFDGFRRTLPCCVASWSQPLRGLSCCAILRPSCCVPRSGIEMSKCGVLRKSLFCNHRRSNPTAKTPIRQPKIQSRQPIGNPTANSVCESKILIFCSSTSASPKLRVGGRGAQTRLIVSRATHEMHFFSFEHSLAGLFYYSVGP